MTNLFSGRCGGSAPRLSAAYAAWLALGVVSFSLRHLPRERLLYIFHASANCSGSSRSARRPKRAAQLLDDAPTLELIGMAFPLGRASAQ